MIGDGSRKAALDLAVAGLDNVELRPPMARTQLLEAYRSADVLFLHLGAVPAFEKVLPSKLFEYAALGKPILAGVAGPRGGFRSRRDRQRRRVCADATLPPRCTRSTVLDLVARP